MSASVEDTVKQILQIRETVLKPVATCQRFELQDEAKIMAPPMVLLLGNHSSGKSSMINHLLGRKVRRTGVAPVDDGFTVLLHADQDTQVDGMALTSNPKLPFEQLASFGPGLVQHLYGQALNVELLKHVRLIDSPGMIDDAGADAHRPYDFLGVIRWAAEQCDLILLFFDPEKPGVVGETMSALTTALSGVDHKLRIVMNKMDLFESIRDFARTYGALCWNLARCIKVKDLPHIYTTVIPEYMREDSALPMDGFAAALLELESYLADLPSRRLDSVLTRVMDETRTLWLRTKITEMARLRVNGMMISTAGLGALLAIVFVIYDIDQWLAYFREDESLVDSSARTVAAEVAEAQGENGGEPVGLGWVLLWTLIPLAIIVGTYFATRLVGKLAEAFWVRRLDNLFKVAFHDELIERDRTDDLAAAWESTKPSLTRHLTKLGLGRLKKVSQRRIMKLRTTLEDVLPNMRRI